METSIRASEIGVYFWCPSTVYGEASIIIFTRKSNFMKKKFSSDINQLRCPLCQYTHRMREVLEIFFKDTSYQETDVLFDKILKTCLTTDKGSFSSAKERADLLLMKKRILQLMRLCMDFTIEVKALSIIRPED